MENDLKKLQLFYASVLADSVSHYSNAGILNLVTQKKLKQQELTASSQLNQLEISTPEELFKHSSRVFGCINWQTQRNGQEISAKGTHCLLCSIAKRMQTAQPCFIYCINPFRAMLKAMKPSYHLMVEKTLWDSDRCEFKMAQKQKADMFRDNTVSDKESELSCS